ncbi:MAG: universal stress protein [Nocardiopsis sp. BM-2018]|nr:MAG: universal stress protein [Nocardiopsis sp. BM-2018]
MPDFPARILIADDGSPEAGRAIDAAVNLVRVTGAALSLVHVKSLEPAVAGTTVTPVRVDQLREQGEELVGRRTARIGEFGIRLEHVEVRLGRSIEATVLRAAADLGTDLLVVGARGRGTVRRRALGDLSTRLVGDAPCSVLVVRGQPSPEPARGLRAYGDEDH